MNYSIHILSFLQVYCYATLCWNEGPSANALRHATTLLSLCCETSKVYLPFLIPEISSLPLTDWLTNIYPIQALKFKQSWNKTPSTYLDRNPYLFFLLSFCNFNSRKTLTDSAATLTEIGLMTYWYFSEELSNRKAKNLSLIKIRILKLWNLLTYILPVNMMKTKFDLITMMKPICLTKLHAQA